MKPTPLAERLHDIVSPHAPGVTIRIGKKEDRSTWELLFAAGTTTAQRAAALAAMRSFDPSKPLPQDIKEEARRRIEAHFPLWKQINILRAGGKELADMSAYIDAVRAASDALEASTPTDFLADHHWPKV